MNTGAKIGLIGGAIGMLIGVAAVVITVGVWGIIFSLIFIGLFGWIFSKFLAPIFQQQKLLKTGEKATATILSVEDTNVTVNNQPMAKIKLRVKRKNGTTYETTETTMVNRLQVGYFTPGQIVTVRYDPLDEMKVAIESIGADSSSSSTSSSQSVATGMDETKMMEKILQEISDENNRLTASGLAAQAVIIRNWNMNVSVNGNNPLMGFWLEVKPEGSNAFEAEAKAVVSELSLPKYQQGATVWVKYDRNDLKKVALDHA